MKSWRHILTDFLNHGLLPFVGRDQELERLVSFWRGTSQFDGVRSMELRAEAGLGKSRVVEEVIARIRGEGGIPLHVRFLPESSGALLPMIGDALRRNRETRSLLQSRHAEGTEPLPALRHVIRLRPVCLIVEDAHLIREGMRNDLQMILDTLSSESVSFLFVLRKPELGIEGVIEPSLVEQMTLSGLHREDVRRLWELLFDAEPEEGIVDALLTPSVGNPLVIRSGLRRALSEELIASGSDGRFALRGSVEGLAEVIAGSASRIGEGMGGALSDVERESASTLALLGEVFAREAAREMFAGADEMIDRLIFRGVLQQHPTPALPIVGTNREYGLYPASTSPLIGFTHSLIHQHFLSGGEVNRSSLGNLIASDLPLYTHVPISRFLSSLSKEFNADADGSKLDAELLYKGLVRSSLLLYDILLSAEWQDAESLIFLFTSALQQVGEYLTEERREDVEVMHLYRKSVWAALQGLPDVEAELVEEADRRTAEPRSAQGALQRLWAIISNPENRWYERSVQEWGIEEAENLAVQFPEIKYRADYARFLCAIGVFAWESRSIPVVRQIEAYYAELLHVRQEYPVLNEARLWFIPVLAQVYESKAELEQRAEQLGSLDHIGVTGALGTHLAEHRVRFYYDTGAVDSLLRAIKESRDIFVMRRTFQLLAKGNGRALVAWGAVGLHPDRIVEEALQFAEAGSEMSSDEFPYSPELLWSYVVVALWLTGDDRWKEIADEHLSEYPELLHPSIARLSGWSNIALEAEESLDQMLERPLLKLDDVIALILQVREGVGDEKEDSERREKLGTALRRSLKWLSERGMPGFMEPLLSIGRQLLPAKEVKKWGEEFREVKRRVHDLLVQVAGDGRLNLKVIGEFRLRDLSGREHSISGGRMKVVLGLIIANEFANRQLSLDEFALLASGNELAEIESARNNLYVRLHSLRKLFGEEGILSAVGEAPRLNRELVRADLLEVQQNILRAGDVLEREAPGRALPLLRDVFTTLSTDVPFPGLFDPFFDAVRDDLEISLRDMLLRVVHEVGEMGDYEGCVTLLQDAFSRTPDDEEVGELLSTLLSKLGRNVAAEQVRRSLRREFYHS
ncbi:MAG: AAA family ATPase [Ignavibacteriae bacterium]|nr:AAA family ATPase [Ignavibacteriota bacterium]MCB9216679.1 AAA family ATPase [Ignavibacteria bacterium]